MRRLFLLVYSGVKLVGARGFEPRLPDGEHCFTGRRGQPYPPCTQKSGAGAVIRTLCASFGDWLLSQEHPGLWQRAEESNPTGSSPVHRFRDGSATIHRRPLNFQIWCWRRDSNSHARRHWFLRPARIHFATRAWSTDPDSNRIRAGLQSAASTASAFSAQKTTNKLWLGRKDSNLRTLGSEPSAVAAVLLPNMLGCGTRYRAELSAFSEQRFHLISFPASTWRSRPDSNRRSAD